MNVGKQVESAAAFFKSLKVYPNKNDLISIFDKSVQKVCRWRCFSHSF